MSRLIDAHIHFWDPTARHHDWLVSIPELAKPFIPLDVEFGVSVPDGLVFVEADCRAGETLSEVDWVTTFSGGDASVPVVGIVAHAPLERGAAAANMLARLSERDLVVGVRRLLQDERPSLLESPGLVEGTRLLADYGLTSDICVTAEQLPAVVDLVDRCPETNFVLDHVGKPSIDRRAADLWRRDLRKLAILPNVNCKLSGLATLAGPGWRAIDALPYLTHALDVFGPGRCMFASDWPILLQNSSYQNWLDAVLEATRDLTLDERGQVLGGTASRVYGLNHPSEERTGHARS